LQEPKTAISGDRDQLDMEKLVCDAMNQDHEYEFRELIAAAGDNGLFERLIPQGDDDPQQHKKRSKLAEIFRRFDQRTFKRSLKFVIIGKKQRERRYCAKKTA